MGHIKVTQIRSTISQKPGIRRTVQGLGLGKIGKSVKQKDNNCIRGMINKVRHLVEYELID